MSNKKKVAIVQSCYIPWKGYFDLIRSVDEFILFDDVQYTRRDWRNRNIIKTPNGLLWLTVPVEVKGNYYQRINETRIADSTWAKNHWKTIMHNYARAPYFKEYKLLFEELYNETVNDQYISQVNFRFIKKIAELLNINTKLTWSTDYKIDDSLAKTDRLLALCQEAQATYYLSGPSAKDYLQEDLFNQSGIEVDYIDYSKYAAYTQLHGEFAHGVTILDLIFNTGEKASDYVKPV